MFRQFNARRRLALLLSVVVLVVLVDGTEASWRSGRQRDEDEDLRLEELRLEALLLKRPSRSHQFQCTVGGAKCFSSAQCCSGFVCAAFDDYFGKNPEIPGFCVKEKDLALCVVASDCEFRTKCLALGRTGQKYCVFSNLHQQPQRDDVAQPAAQSADYRQIRPHGGLGSTCQDGSDCKAEAADGAALCCQDVRRGRQGVKRMCSRVIAISQCIGGSNAV